MEELFFLLIPHPSALIPWFDMKDVIYVLFKGVIVRDDEELIEVLHLSDLLCEALAALLIHVDRRLVEEGQAYVGELFEEREAYGESGGHLLAARQVRKGALVPLFFQHDLVVARPTERTPGLARDLAK